MIHDRKLLTAKFAAVLTALPVLIYAFSTGPDPRKTGVPGEGICTECHLGTPLNGGGGKVEIAFPNGLTYSPGVKQRLTLTITDSAARVYGFQLTARLVSDLHNGQAGRLEPVPGDSTVFVLCVDGSNRGAGSCPAGAAVESIEHNIPHRSNVIQVDWTPPASDQGPVRIFVAANAANGDGTPGGDHIYDANYTLTPLSSGDSGGPTLTQTNPVLNGASFTPGIAPCAWISIFGSSLAANARTWRDDEIVNGVLPTSLDGVSVKVDGKPAAVYFISPAQLNVQVPDDSSAGTVPVEVTTPQGIVTTTATMQQFAPAMFMFDPENRRYVAAQHADFSIVGKPGLFPGATSTPAKPGEVIILYATGFGPTNPPVPAGQVVTQAQPLANPVAVSIGGVPAQVQFAGLSIAGVYQLNVVVPDGTPDGDAAMVAQVGGQQTQANAFITVQK